MRVLLLASPIACLLGPPELVSDTGPRWVMKLGRTASFYEGFSVQWVEHIQLVHVIQDLQLCLRSKGRHSTDLGLVEPVFVNQPRDNPKVEETQHEDAILGTSFLPSSALFNFQPLEHQLAATHISYLEWDAFVKRHGNHLEEPTVAVDLLYMSSYKAAVPCPDPEHVHTAELNGVEVVARKVRCIDKIPFDFFTTVVRELCDSQFLPSSIGLEFRMPGGNMMHTTMNWAGYRQLRAPFHFSSQVEHQVQEFIDRRLPQPFLSVHWRRGLDYYNQMASSEVVTSVIREGLSQCRCSTVFLMTNSGTARDIQMIYDQLAGIRIVRLEQTSGWEHALLHLAIEMSIASRAAYFIPFRSSLVSRMIAEHRLLIHSFSVGSILDTAQLGASGMEQVFWWKQREQEEL